MKGGAMSNLRELSEDLVQLGRMLDGSAGQLDAEIRDAITEQVGLLEDDLQDKVESIVSLIREKKAMHEIRMAEANRLRDLARIDLNTANRLHDWLHFNLKRIGKEKIETPLCKVAVRANSGKQPIEINVPHLPAEYTIHRSSTVANKEKIREAIEAGTEVPGVTIKNRGTHLSIR
jgi:hypothetical protein